ncbi:MAG: DUF4272 domain-containing protein [Polyangiaceae bacterium]|nr:DUF4272 domain-containing protein [Polyangiaceae bacterium]
MGLFTKQKERPDAADVVRRAVILKHVVVYAGSTPPREVLPGIMAKWTVEDRRRFRADADAQRDAFWSSLDSLRGELSPWEQSYSRATMLTMTRQQQLDASWRTEAAVVLIWALGEIEFLPAYDVSADSDPLKGFPPEPFADYVGRARLRARADIERARDTAELWHWRARTHEIMARGDRFPESDEARRAGIRSFADVVRLAARTAAERGTIPAALEDDFPALGRPYRELSELDFSRLRSIAAERHFALNWLCGCAPGHRWDDTPTDT